MSSVDGVILTINLTEADLTKKMDLDMISGAVHYSKYRLHRVFFDTVSLTIHDYTQCRQLTESVKLPVFSCKSTIQITFSPGYQSQQAFTNAFTVMYKMPPNMYRENERFYPLQFKFDFEGSYGMLDREEKVSWEIPFAPDEDVQGWMELVGLVIDGFPHLSEEEHIRVLRQRISTRQVFTLKDGETAIDTMLFSYENDSIDFMRSHPLHRKRNVPKAMLDKVMRELFKGKKISIITYREGNKADTGYRKGITGMGFAEAELLVEYDYPTQRFTLQREGRDHE